MEFQIGDIIYIAYSPEEPEPYGVITSVYLDEGLCGVMWFDGQVSKERTFLMRKAEL